MSENKTHRRKSKFDYLKIFLLAQATKRLTSCKASHDFTGILSDQNLVIDVSQSLSSNSFVKDSSLLKLGNFRTSYSRNSINISKSQEVESLHSLLTGVRCCSDSFLNDWYASEVCSRSLYVTPVVDNLDCCERKYNNFKRRKLPDAFPSLLDIKRKCVSNYELSHINNISNLNAFVKISPYSILNHLYKFIVEVIITFILLIY